MPARARIRPSQPNPSVVVERKEEKKMTVNKDKNLEPNRGRDRKKSRIPRVFN